MAHESFSVTYDGPGLQGGRMAVKDLAPALLDLGELFVACGKELFPEYKPVALTITATHQGSFIVDLALEASGLWSQLSHAISGESSTDVEELLGLVAGARGLLAFIKRVGTRRIVDTQLLAAKPGQVLVRFENGDVIVADAATVRLYQNKLVRRKVRGVVRPLTKDGIESLAVDVNGKRTVDLSEQDVPAFEPIAPTTAVEPITSEAEMLLDVKTVSFSEGNKWRFDDGETSFAAEICDPQFLRNVGDGEPFAAGDRLRAVVRTSQVDGPNGLQTTRELVEITEHVSRPQLRLDDPPEAP